MSATLLREPEQPTPRAATAAVATSAVPPAPRSRAWYAHAWYPLLVPIWLVVRMAAANVGDLLGPGELARPLALTAAGALVAYAAARVVARDADQRGLVALLLVLWFAEFGTMREALRRTGALAAAAGDAPMIVTGLFVALAIAVVLRLRPARPPVTRFLNVASLALLAFPLPELVRGLWRDRTPPPLEWALPPAPAMTSAASASRPDVYLLILDQYTGVGSLRANYGFDNEPFLRALEARGFVTPRRARSNYPLTHLSLSSMLNWTYLPGGPDDATHARDALPRSYARIETNRTAETLRRAGYRYLFMPGGYAATARSRRADATIDIGQARWSEFERTWWSGTMLVPLERQVCLRSAAACRWLRRRQALDSPEAVGAGFRLVSDVADDRGPKFVLAHFTVPHDPWLFDADCSHRDVDLRLKSGAAPETGERERIAKAGYIGQIRCVNRLVLGMIDSLDARSTTRPVILLQSDHGNGRIGSGHLPKDSLPADRVAERFDIFAAYRYAGAATVVHDSIAPVNALPAMLNAVVGTAIAMQPQRSYWATWTTPFRFVAVE